LVRIEVVDQLFVDFSLEPVVCHRRADARACRRPTWTAGRRSCLARRYRRLETTRVDRSELRIPKLRNPHPAPPSLARRLSPTSCPAIRAAGRVALDPDALDVLDRLWPEWRVQPEVAVAADAA
jgi:hypothetical protein